MGNQAQPVVPQPSCGDAVHSVVRAVLASTPLVGNAATEMFNWFIKPPLERRRDEWMQDIGKRLLQLESEHGVRVEKLQNDDAFVDTVLRATQVAMRNSQEEKREALRNAVTNAALPGAPDESERQMFLNLIDQFTIWHLRLLDLFADPKVWFARNGKPVPAQYIGGLSTVLESAWPELKGKRDFYDQVWREINGSGLTNTPELHGMMSGNGLTAQRVSARGADFLRFMREPAPADQTADKKAPGI